MRKRERERVNGLILYASIYYKLERRCIQFTNKSMSLTKQRHWLDER